MGDLEARIRERAEIDLFAAVDRGALLALKCPDSYDRLSGSFAK